VRLSPLGTSATVGLLYQPRIIDDDDYGAVGGMKIGRGNRSTRRKPAPVPLCPPQIPHDLGSNPGRRGGKPATNRLSYGTASLFHLLSVSYINPDFRLADYSPCHLLSRWFHDQLIFSTLKMEAIFSSEMSVDTQRTTRRHIPEDGTLHNHRCENLKSCKIYFLYLCLKFCPYVLYNLTLGTFPI
jgi:hypothetical protein